LRAHSLFWSACGCRKPGSVDPPRTPIMLPWPSPNRRDELIKKSPVLKL
jgi:hypothetical protein